MKSKILIISDRLSNDFEIDSVVNSELEYIIIDNIEYGVGYLFVNKDEKCPKIVLMDYNEEWIEKFVGLCKEVDIDLSTFNFITTIGKQYHKIIVKDFTSYVSITDYELQSYLV